jgi:hypothetical protein
VYTGIKSPTKGINSIVFMAEDTLLLVIENNMLVTITSNMSPIIGGTENWSCNEIYGIGD